MYNYVGQCTQNAENYIKNNISTLPKVAPMGFFPES